MTPNQAISINADELARAVEWHDDKPDERADLHIVTQPGDLDLVGRPLRPGR